MIVYTLHTAPKLEFRSFKGVNFEALIRVRVFLWCSCKYIIHKYCVIILTQQQFYVC